jgi:hypothetical protein
MSIVDPDILERIRAALPEDAVVSDLGTGAVLVFAKGRSLGCVSILPSLKQWAPGETNQPFDSHQWRGEPTRSKTRYSGAGWLKRLSQAAWRALTKPEEN